MFHIIKKYKSIIICMAILSLTACSSSRLSKSEKKRYSKMKEKNLSEEALNNFNRRRFKKAIKIYELILNKKNPDIRYAAWARYEIGFCYYYMKDFVNAKLHFEKVLKDYPEKINTGPRLLAAKLIKKIVNKKTEGI